MCCTVKPYAFQKCSANRYASDESDGDVMKIGFDMRYHPDIHWIVVSNSKLNQPQ